VSTDADPHSTGAPPAIGDVGRAFAAASGRAEIIVVVVAAVVGPLVSILVNLGLAVTPLGRGWLELPVPWLSFSDVFFVLLLGVLWTVVAIALMPARIRPAMEAFTWAGERSLEAMRAATGRDDAPTSPDAARRWLDRTPETAANRWIRVEALLLAGDHAEARATAERMTDDEPVAAWQRADALATVDIVATGSVDLAAYRAAVAALDGEVALDGAAGLAIMESRVAIGAGADWIAPLTAVRERIGQAADGILWRRYLVRRLRAALPIMAAFAIGLGLIELLFG
jgi:hypothetical protein